MSSGPTDKNDFFYEMMMQDPPKKSSDDVRRFCDDYLSVAGYKSTKEVLGDEGRNVQKAHDQSNGSTGGKGGGEKPAAMQVAEGTRPHQ